MSWWWWPAISLSFLWWEIYFLPFTLLVFIKDCPASLPFLCIQLLGLNQIFSSSLTFSWSNAPLLVVVKSLSSLFSQYIDLNNMLVNFFNPPSSHSIQKYSFTEFLRHKRKSWILTCHACHPPRPCCLASNVCVVLKPCMCCRCNYYTEKKRAPSSLSVCGCKLLWNKK